MTVAPLFVVAGTGTGIGKTTIASALVRALSIGGRRVAGLKPVETGVEREGEGDGATLGQTSTFHVKQRPPYLFMDAVSPHLAARRCGATISIDRIAEWVAPVRGDADAVVVELAGGLFTPLTESETNADLVRRLDPTWTLLVAPDRLGVLHDVLAVVHAARARDVALHGIVLSAPEGPDTSTGTNAEELGRLVDAPRVLATFPRAAEGVLQEHASQVLERLPRG